MSNTFKRLSFEQLLDLAEQTSSPEERTALRAKLHPDDLATFTWLEHTLPLMRTDTSFDAPPEVIARAARLIRPVAPPRAPSLRERVLAVLQFDSRQRPTYGIRSGFSSTHQLIYSAGEHDVDLRMTPSGAEWHVSGQLLGPEQPGQVVLSGENLRVSVPLNQLAEFVLPPVAPGSYTLTLELPATEIVIDELNLAI